jgi:competence protein ComEA
MERSRGQVLVWLAAAVLATLALVRLFDGGGGSAGSASPPVKVDRSVEAGAESGAGNGGEVFVHVTGRVRRPGLYRVPASARVAVAIGRAGGPVDGADMAAVNLAARVEDGQQIVLPRAGATPAAGGEQPGAAGAAGAKLSLAQASQEQLEELDGIGPTLAKRILEYRDENGGFRSLDELKEVEGIGEKRFESLREAVTP